MRTLIFIISLFFAHAAQSQIVKGTAIWYFDSIPNVAANAAYRGTELAYSIALEKMYRWDRQAAAWVELTANVYELDAVGDTSTITIPQEGDLAITPGVLLIRAATSWLQFQGGDDWGDQVVAKDSTLRGAGTAGDPLRVNRDSFPTRAIVEDSIAAVREDILPTDLSFSGASSPVALQSSTGTDVSFLAGSGIGLAQAGNALTINNTGVTGTSAATTYLPRWSSLSPPVLGGDSRYQFKDAYPAIEIIGSYNSNSTQLLLSAGGSNPRIQSNTGNNGMIMAVGGNGSLSVQNTTGTIRFEIIGGSSRSYFSTSLGVGLSGTPAARLHSTGSGSTSSTFSLIAENSSGTDALQVRDDGAVFVPVRSGTSTALGGWTSDHRATNVNVEPGLTLNAGTLYVNRDSFPNFNDIPASVNLYNSNGSLTGNRTVQLSTSSLEFFREGNNYVPYDFNSTLYHRIGTDTFFIADQSYAYPLEGEMLSIEDDSGTRSAKLGFGLDPDFTYGPAHVGFFKFAGTEFDDGTQLSFMHNAYQYFIKIADPDNLDDNIGFSFSRAYGFVIEREDAGTDFLEFIGTGMGEFKFTSSGIRYDGALIGETNIGQYIETIPYVTNFPTSLAGWSTAPLAGSKYISKIDLGSRLNFSNDTLNVSTVMLSGYATKTVANTTSTTTLKPTTAAGDDGVLGLKAGQSYKVEASGYYTTDTINTNITISLTLNGATVATTGSVALEVTEGGQFHIEGIVTIYSIGDPGTTFSQGRAEFIHTQGDADVYRMLRTATNSINTAITATFGLQAAWTTASTANSLTCTNYIVEQLITAE